jgi:beta-ribofuranosylaminobenzene 5'-phosphate synthase
LIIQTPSRLHLTLIDLNGTQGRLDGGVGITIKDPRLSLRIEPTDQGIGVHFKDSNKLDNKLKEDYTQKIYNSAINAMKHFQIDSGFDFFVEDTYPAHSGLGSGTQISLATAKLIAAYNGIDIESSQLGKIVGRGGTSGIGVGAFQEGGFIVDGGHSNDEKPGFLPSSASKASPPPILARYNFPEDWDIIIAIPQIEDRVSGSKEVNIFQEFCPIPLRDVERLSHVILMKLMPSVLEKDIVSFGNAINQIQSIGFKKVEMDLQDKLISDILGNMRDSGAAGAGMSSFGPTVYAVTDNNSKDILKSVKEIMPDSEGVSFITKAQNTGAILHDHLK